MENELCAFFRWNDKIGIRYLFSIFIILVNRRLNLLIREQLYWLKRANYLHCLVLPKRLTGSLPATDNDRPGSFVSNFYLSFSFFIISCRLSIDVLPQSKLQFVGLIVLKTLLTQYQLLMLIMG